MINLFSRGRMLIMAGTLSIAAIGGSLAYTAANTVPASRAGDGSGTISGFVISNIHYALNATLAENVDAVTFDLDGAPPAGSTLKAQFVTAGNWYTCTNTGTAVSCDTTTPQLTVLPTDNLRVIIAQ